MPRHTTGHAGVSCRRPPRPRSTRISPRPQARPAPAPTGSTRPRSRSPFALRSSPTLKSLSSILILQNGLARPRPHQHSRDGAASRPMPLRFGTRRRFSRSARWDGQSLARRRSGHSWCEGHSDRASVTPLRGRCVSMAREFQPPASRGLLAPPERTRAWRQPARVRRARKATRYWYFLAKSSWHCASRPPCPASRGAPTRPAVLPLLHTPFHLQTKAALRYFLFTFTPRRCSSGVEQRIRNARVVGSIPTIGSRFKSGK